MVPDRELLRQYVKVGSEAAFAELMRRHLDMVYSAALRLVGGNRPLAEDVTQTVFTALARQAPSLLGHPTLAGWLHTATHFTAHKARRGEMRLVTHEHEASAMQDTAAQPEIHWQELCAELDGLVNSLKPDDRNAVLLRFFEGKTHGEIGAVLGLSENAARMRVDRALEKLRSLFHRRGVTVASATLAASLTAHSTHAAPIGLAAKVAAASFAGAGSAATGSGLVKTLTTAFHVHNKTNLAAAAVLLLAVALNVYQSQLNAKLAVELATPVKPKPVLIAKPAPPKVVITEEVGDAQLSLSLVRQPGVPTILRKVGARFYPITLDEMERDPVLLAQFASHIRSSGNEPALLTLLQKMFSNQADRSSFEKILKDREMRTELLILQSAHAQLTAGEMAEFTKRRLALFEAADAKIMALASTDEARALYAQYQTAQDQQYSEHEINFFAGLLAKADPSGTLDLTAEQRAAMVKMLADERNQPDLSGNYEYLLAEVTGSFSLFDAQKQTLESRLAERAASILTPEQLLVFQQRVHLSTQFMVTPTLFRLDHDLSILPRGMGPAATTAELVLISPMQNGASSGPNFSYSSKLLSPAQ